MNLKELKENISLIRKTLDTTISDPTNGNELVVLLSEISAIQAMSADVKARAKSFYVNKYASIVEQGTYSTLSAKDRGYLIERDCLEFSEILEKAENYNKEIHYKLETMRTMVSHAKELIKNNL